MGKFVDYTDRVLLSLRSSAGSFDAILVSLYRLETNCSVIVSGLEVLILEAIELLLLSLVTFSWNISPFSMSQINCPYCSYLIFNLAVWIVSGTYEIPFSTQAMDPIFFLLYDPSL